mmetsp:Transcript_60605/g.156157  ORF Transcript_60605/g.156157 Transcript_60605/m.156157 type:complete len:201 (-) Transcript_60605:11-613(-)
MNLKKPSWLSATSVLSRSQKGETGRPNSSSMSPCRKNSALMRMVHCAWRSKGLALCATSQALSRKASSCSSCAGSSSALLAAASRWRNSWRKRLSNITCLPRSVSRIIFTTRLRNCFWSSGARCAMMSQWLTRSTANVSVQCMFSRTLWSLNSLASVVPAFVWKRFEVPVCPTSCAIAATRHESHSTGSTLQKAVLLSRR